MTTSRQPKASTSKASGPRSVRRRDGLSVHICETCGSCVDGNAPLRKFDPDWEYKIDDLIITASLKAREVLVDGIGKLYRSNGTAPRAPAPASSEKAPVNGERVLRNIEQMLAAAPVRPAAREQGGGGKPQKRTKRNLCKHGYYDALKWCPCCKERGRPPRKRSPRSR